MAYTLKVNGQSTTVDAPPDMPLLWVLRDLMNLRGTKYGCGIGQCAACTVQLNGKAARACQTPVSAVGNQAVTTIEGLSLDGTHPVQVAWTEIDVPQCGYCQAGTDDGGGGAAGQKAQPDGRRYRFRHERQSLPLRNLPAHSEGDPQGRHVVETQRVCQNSADARRDKEDKE